MCGFAGVVVWDERFRVSRETLEEMSARVAHRGPDGQGLYLSPDAAITPDRPQVGLVHRRLAILDLDPRANQPFTDGQGCWIVFNGEIYNFRDLRGELSKLVPEYRWRTSGDTEVLLAAYRVWGEKCVEHLNGMFAFAIWSPRDRTLHLARDPLGIRPLVLGELDGCPILASETCALDIIGAKYVRDVEPGEVIVFDERGVQSHKPFPPKPARPCIFEYIYFSRPDSIVGGRSVYEVRKAFGAQLARESHVEVDVVVPVPDSGVPAAVGYSQHSGVPFELGIIRNHYVGRTFIQPTQSVRELGVRMKHNANRAAIEGKRIILIDDSLVRGTTSKKIVRMMRDAGAREVHFRLASPPIIHPDYYGIDLPDRGGLLAATHNLEEMRAIIGADSLAFLSIDGMYRAMGEPGRDPVNPKFSDHCFTGDYPTHLPDQTQVEPQPRQLSLLAEAS